MFIHEIFSCSRSEADLDNVPPDHVINMLEGLTSICHFCLLESTSSLSAMSGRHTGASSAEPESSTSAPLFSGLFGALTRDRTKVMVIGEMISFRTWTRDLGLFFLSFLHNFIYYNVMYL